MEMQVWKDRFPGVPDCCQGLSGIDPIALRDKGGVLLQVAVNDFESSVVHNDDLVASTQQRRRVAAGVGVALLHIRHQPRPNGTHNGS